MATIIFLLAFGAIVAVFAGIVELSDVVRGRLRAARLREVERHRGVLFPVGVCRQPCACLSCGTRVRAPRRDQTGGAA